MELILLNIGEHFWRPGFSRLFLAARGAADFAHQDRVSVERHGHMTVPVLLPRIDVRGINSGQRKLDFALAPSRPTMERFNTVMYRFLLLAWLCANGSATPATRPMAA